VTRYRVELAPEALEQAHAIDEWWRENRPAAADLFVAELTVALERLEVSPLSSARYDKTGMVGLRRLFLPRTRYHVYFTVVGDEAIVRVHAIWHSAKGRGPQLP
jgi:plasmid stabilization system protein ParE